MTDFIGIDIGATNIRVGTIDEDENISFIHKELTFNNVKSSEDLYQKISNLIKLVPNYEMAKAIGIGVPGAIDKSIGKVLSCNKNIEILKDILFVERLNNDFNKPVFIENDARVAALAEALKGRGENKNIVCFITISTGLGGGLVCKKKIYSGSNNLGAYFARMILDGKNTSDNLISGRALLKQAKEKISDKIDNLSKLFELEKSNITANEIIENFKENLNVLLLNISSTINPDIIIIGGGVTKSKEYFLEDVKKRFKEKCHLFAKETIIDIAEFEEPGVLGSALLAKSGYNKQ